MSTTRKYTLKTDFFKKIDSPEKAYILGFLYADGYNNTEKREISIVQKIGSEDILYKIKTVLNYSGPIRSKKTKFLELRIACKEMSDDLSNLGCIKGKSLTLNYPNIPSHLNSHFIRGVFDGDGSICLRYNISKMLNNTERKTQFSISGYVPFLKQIQEILSSECNINKNKIIKEKRRKSNIGYLAYSGCRQCIKIRDYLYKDATIYMNRKYILFKKLGTDEWPTYPKKSVRPKPNTCYYCKKTISSRSRYATLKDNNHIVCSSCAIKNGLDLSPQIIRRNNFLIKNNVCHVICKNGEFVVDISDLDKIKEFHWRIEKNRVLSTYRDVSNKKKCIYLNRFLMNAKPDEIIIFKDNNKLNLKRDNLERRYR